MAKPSEQLARLGLELPAAPKPVGGYVPARAAGRLIFVSGQLPIRAGQLACSGKVGGRVSVAEAREAARLCALNALSAAAETAGGLDNLAGVVRVDVFVNADSGFTAHADVANGASELLAGLFGKAGRHARAAVGASSLPLGAAVEVAVIFERTA